MSRHINTEAFQMDLRSSPSQQHLNPSRSSSLDSQERANELDPPTAIESRPHKLDLYSIPVFLLELLVLAGLAYSAYYIHFQYQHEPMISGFYCDDTSYRQQYDETKLTQQFSREENELTVLSLALALPVVVIIFCELVNSMFGSIKFRQIRALCTCCKLHSITRRTIRFSGAYILGFIIVLISCDILANTTGRLRPYFAQECPNAYQPCVKQIPKEPTMLTLPSSPPPSLSSMLPSGSPPATVSLDSQSEPTRDVVVDSSARSISRQPVASALVRQPEGAAYLSAIVERHWVDLTGQNLTILCGLEGPHDEVMRKSQMLAMSWPSSPAAVLTYASLFIACYLSFVGTARPFRIITSVLVMVLLLGATLFNVQLVKDHFHHWDDVAASAVLALVVVVFVLHVYLNKFKDTHYYENQKLYRRKFYVYDNFKGNQNEGATGQYSLDKTEPTRVSPGQEHLQNGDIGAGGGMSNNDLAMRYFQIPRANYRGRSNR